MSTPVGIAARDVRHRYGDHLAVDGVTFEVASGEIFGLLGPNGAGKTTILRALAGVLHPTEGQTEIMGIDVQKDPLSAKRCLGFLSGDTALYQRLSVRELLHYFGRLHDLSGPEIGARVAAVTRDFGLDGLLDARVGALSTGQRQRANLARAFLLDPPVLILDEPTAGLDVVSGEFVAQAIRRAKASQKAVLFSTHVMSEVDALCDRIGLLVEGRLAAVGPSADVLAEHRAASLGELILRLHRASVAPGGLE